MWRVHRSALANKVWPMARNLTWRNPGDLFR
jgi:hypothetical protein